MPINTSSDTAFLYPAKIFSSLKNLSEETIEMLEKNCRVICLKFNRSIKSTMWLYVNEQPPEEVMCFYTNTPENIKDNDLIVINKKLIIEAGAIMYIGIGYENRIRKLRVCSVVRRIPNGVYNVSTYTRISRTLDDIKQEGILFERKVDSVLWQTTVFFFLFFSVWLVIVYFFSHIFLNIGLFCIILGF